MCFTIFTNIVRVGIDLKETNLSQDRVNYPRLGLLRQKFKIPIKSKTKTPMKKTLVLLLLLLPLGGTAQKKFGALIGFNNSSISEGFLSELYITDKLGFHIGGFYELELDEKLVFRPKLLYSQQGNRDSYRNRRTEPLNYLNIPLDFKFFNTTYLLVGPQIGFLVSENNSAFTSGPKSSFDMGLKLGLGQRFKDLVIELNLYQGLTTAIENVDFDKGTNTVIQLSIGYYLF